VMQTVSGFMIVTNGARILVKGKIFRAGQTEGMSALRENRTKKKL